MSTFFTICKVYRTITPSNNQSHPCKLALSINLNRLRWLPESSSVGESHPHALTDTDVNLSVHPAPIDQP